MLLLALRNSFCRSLEASHHDFANIVGKIDRIMDWQSFNQQCLIVQQIRVEI